MLKWPCLGLIQLCSQSWAQNGPAAAGMWGWLFRGGWWPWVWSPQSPSSSTASLELAQWCCWYPGDGSKPPHRNQELRDKNGGCRGASAPLAPSWFRFLCLQSLHPGLHAMDQEPAAEQEQANGQLTAPARITVAGTMAIAVGTTPNVASLMAVPLQPSSPGCHLRTRAVWAEGAALCSF